MRYTHLLLASVILLGAVANPAAGQFGLLSQERTVTPLPAAMTFEEFQDMNRSLTVGLLLALVPIPGMLHYYANEETTHLLILSTAAIGAGAIIIGSLIDAPGDFPDSDFDLLTLYPGDSDRERRFEKTPLEIVGLDTTYTLREISRKPGGISLAFKFAGAVLISGAFAYDIFHGISIIQEKRDRILFKYGQQLSLRLSPKIEVGQGGAGLTLEMSF